MADIAILVAEEYERRMKKCCSAKKRIQDDEDDKGRRLTGGSGIAVLGQEIGVGGAGWSSWMKKVEQGNKKVEFLLKNKMLEPKSPLGVLAINGVFSA